MSHLEVWQAAARLEEAREPFVLVTLVSARGEAPQEPGAKAVINRGGLVAGTVGGGKLEAAAIRRAGELLEAQARARAAAAPVSVTWNLQRELGMTCGGEVTLLFETRGAASWKLVVFGAGHVAQALVRMLTRLDCQVTCIDSRPEWLARLPESPRLQKLHLESPADYIAQLDGAEFIITMTQGHATDVPILSALYRRFRRPPYVGAIGSPIKALKLRRELQELGATAEAMAALHCPIGRGAGRSEPEEIAICTVAELIEVRDRLADAPET